MANELTALLPTIVGQALIKLKNTAKIFKMVKMDFANEVKQPGNVINFVGRSAFTPTEVVVGTPNVQDITAAGGSMALNIYKEISWRMSIKEASELIASKGLVLSNTLEDAVDSMRDYIASLVYAAAYKKFYTTTGTIGTVPSAISDITDIRKKANALKWPVANRNIVWDGASEAKMLQLAILTEQSSTGDNTLITGDLGRRFGFTHWTDNPMDDLAHVLGGADGAYVVNDDAGASANAVGSKALIVETGAGTITAGSIFTIAGDTQQYVVTADSAGGAGTLAIEPGLKIAPANHAAITFQATQSHMSLAFHRDAIGLAVRPLARSMANPNESVVSDPESGLSLKMVILPEHGADIMSLFFLGGTDVLNSDLGIRVNSGA